MDRSKPADDKIQDGDTMKIAPRTPDTDDDGHSPHPSQVFLRASAPKDGRSRLANNLQAEIDEELIQRYKGMVP